MAAPGVRSGRRSVGTNSMSPSSSAKKPRRGGALWWTWKRRRKAGSEMRRRQRLQMREARVSDEGSGGRRRKISRWRSSLSGKGATSVSSAGEWRASGGAAYRRRRKHALLGWIDEDNSHE
ncbi:hypothetical protein ZEAMMB73_Zm00001d035247 [Zea mays]|uniref:Uncharacterized protein n=1 Tax=Zea mays TaxID=4577 RepID=A0A1D6LF47_MAIZE|nr:hypothetical protein ZEAMMB73_Zm00001d035247 [Zea mays]AQK78567.1 hypothetical protein ZEAMMB73_Zm00001d035247 [Zea mays]